MKSSKWLNYVLEALGLGAFMVSAGVFATLLYFPGSPVLRLIPSPTLRNVLMGLAMGLTAIAIIYSPGGKRSGAHINPAVTLTFLSLKKITAADAVAYIVAQCIGGVLGVWFVALILGTPFTSLPVHYVVTAPGTGGSWLAFATEFLLSFGLMLMVLFTSNAERFKPYTGLFAGILLTVYIPLASSISGMSINPARTLASALPAHQWTSFWIYLIAPPLAMLCAARLYVRWTRCNLRTVCCKLCPNDHTPCISPRCCCAIPVPDLTYPNLPPVE